MAPVTGDPQPIRAGTALEGWHSLLSFGTVQASMSSPKSKGGTHVDTVMGRRKGRMNPQIHRSHFCGYAPAESVFDSRANFLHTYLGLHRRSLLEKHHILRCMGLWGHACDSSHGIFWWQGSSFFGMTIPGAQGDAKNGKLAGNAFWLHKNAACFRVPLVLHLGAVGYHIARGHPILARMGIGSASP